VELSELVNQLHAINARIGALMLLPPNGEVVELRWAEDRVNDAIDQLLRVAAADVVRQFLKEGK
jgi:hypothetical protein